jgi:hypothetical protein
MVFILTFNNNIVISWRLILLVKEIAVPGENHRPAQVNKEKKYSVNTNKSMELNQAMGFLIYTSYSGFSII